LEEVASTRRATGYDEVWSLGDSLMSGEWHEIKREEDITYVWPDSSVDTYSEFVSFSGSGDFMGMTLALGYDQKGNVVGFVLGAGGGSKRGLTVFFPADDFAESGELVSMIRGGGATGRSGFAPGETLPASYGRFTTDVLRDRVAGKWNVQAVVAKLDDQNAMLAHTALQARLRNIA
jgi:hypothetical protein